MTEQQHAVHSRSHGKDASAVGPEEVSCHQHDQHAPPDLAMQLGLPVLLALAAASTTSPTTSHVGDRIPAPQGVIRSGLSVSDGGAQEEDHVKGQAESSNSGTLRLFEDGRPRPKGQQESGIPLLWQSHTNARGTRVIERPEWPCNVEGVPNLSPSDPICALFRGEGMLPSSRTFGSRCGHGGLSSQGQDRKGPQSPRHI